MVPHQQQLMPGPPQSMPHPPQQFFPQFPVANSVPTDSESDGDESEFRDCNTVPRWHLLIPAIRLACDPEQCVPRLSFMTGKICGPNLTISVNEDDDMSLLPPPPYMPEMMQQSLPRQPYHRTGGNVHLWIFIRELLECPDQYGGCVRWVDRLAGEI